MAAAGLILLAGCTPPKEAEKPAVTPPASVTAPEPKPTPPDTTPEPPSDASANMANYLSGMEKGLIARGFLRTDDGRGIEVDTETLVHIFTAVALHNEYSWQGADLVPSAHPSPLRRWADPVRMEIRFGDSITPEQRRKDRAAIAETAAQLQAATGHPVSLVGAGGNFIVLILNEDERRAIAPDLGMVLPGMPASDMQALGNLPMQNYCAVFAYSRGGRPVYDHALALIRAELPPRLRLSCFHEELAQGMGAANDSPLARPSVFNDDEEFAYLTWLDEMLLKMLYDPRLAPGMTEAEALPIIRQIAAELIPPPGS